MPQISAFSNILAFKTLDIGASNLSHPDPATWGLLTGSASISNPVSAYIIIMKGAVPTDLAAFTVPKYRADTDQLVIFGTGGTRDPINGSSDFYLATYPAYDKAVINTDYVNATGSGTATWFLMETYSPTYGVGSQLVGTVGAIGSGADMELETTSIVSGSPYRLLGWKLQFPTTWTI